MGAMNLDMEFFTSRYEDLLAWARRWSLFQYPFVTACCGMEFMSLNGPRYDGLARFGAEAPRFSPRQADLLWVVGTISQKQAPALKRIYEQMMEPKWVVAFGTCASCGGFYDNYATVAGIDKVIPVDVYVPGCPPRPEAVLDGLMLLQEKITSRGQGPRIVPTKQVPRLTQLKKKASTVQLALEEQKLLEAERKTTVQETTLLHDAEHERIKP
ncbi:MAG: NADH-quinone oxidoreductase subunit NuoB [Sandaracinaceae bacterium]|nr:NADH-quinone oxidoreductase subunit NuoB [Sandaracinaceae bacterium]